MGTLIQPVINLMGLACVVAVVPLVAFPLGVMVIKQIRSIGSYIKQVGWLSNWRADWLE